MNRFLAFALVFIFSVFAHANADDPISKIDHDSNQPVEIISDKLEVFQDQGKAVFSGNVEASQGKIKMKAASMNVFFSKNKKQESGKKTAITKVEAVNNVELFTEKEKALGNKGVFNLVDKTITLSGNVSLMNKQTILKGSRFTYNIETGKSSLEASTKVDGNQRVRGIFIPE